MGCLQSLFNIPVPWYLFDTVLKVISWPAFVSRCIIDAYFSFYGLVLDIDMNCGCRLYRSFCQMDLTYTMDCLLLYNRYECRFSLDGITTLHTTMTITNTLKITLTPLRLHSASSVRIPNSINNFRTLIPALRLRPLNLSSASSVNLHGLANTSIFHNNLRVMLSPIKSPVLRKYSNPFKRPGPGFEGRIWDLIVSVPDHCLSFYFPSRIDLKKM